MISKKVAQVWYSSARGRRYLTKRAAVAAEATAIILQKYPPEPYDISTGEPGWNIRENEPDIFEKMHRRMCRIISKASDSGVAA